MKLTVLMTELSTHVSDVPHTLMGSAVQTSIAKLAACDVFQTDCDDISERKGLGEYELSMEVDGTITRVLGVYREGRKLESVSRARFEEAAQDKGTPLYFDRSGTVLRLAPVPNKDARNVVKTRVAYIPLRGSSEVDDEVAAKYYDIILRGAIVALLEMPGNSWTSPTTAAVYRAQLENDYNNARNNARGLTDGKRISSGFR